MANKTDNLNLTLPLNNEFRDIWDEPLNDNLVVIDEVLGDLRDEVIAARGSQTSLTDRLNNGLQANGQPLPAAEVVAARSSKLYGHRVPVGNALATLPFRLDSLDTEMRKAREASATLRAALAARAFLLPDAVIDGPKNSNGYPTWMGTSGTNVNIDPNGTPMPLIIGGKMARIRTLHQEDASLLADGTYIVYADYQEDGVVVESGIAGDITNVDEANSDRRILKEASKDFAAAGVEVGDILVVSNTSHAGTYVITDVGYDSEPDQIRIMGIFPGALNESGAIYDIYDPLAVEFGFVALSSAFPKVDDRLYLGEIVMNTGAIDSFLPYHFKDTFIGEWKAFNVTTPGQIALSWNHNLGSDVLDVSVQVSQANDGSAPVEEMSVSKMQNTQSFTPPSHAADTFNAGTSDASFTSGTFAPGGLTGTVQDRRSIRLKWTRNVAYVDNIVASYVYEDYDNIERKTGYMRVIIRKRG